MSEITYTLRHPVEIKAKDGHVIEKYETVTMHRLKGRDMRAAMVNGAGLSAIVLLEKSARLPPTVIDEMDGQDVAVLMGMVSDFLGVSPETLSA